jgi:hypothetical protein
MPFFHNRAALFAVAAILTTSACGGNATVPSNAGAINPSLPLGISQERSISPDDTKSILKKLKKDVVIGSTVDPANGDTGPRAISQVRVGFGKLKKGQLVVCNFADSSGTAGNGTTVEALDTTPGSKPVTFVQSSKIQGCDGDGLSAENHTYAASLGNHDVVDYDQNGNYVKTYSSPIAAPVTSADAFCGQPYAPEDIYVGDSQTGGIVKFAAGLYGNPKPVEVIMGFDVNKGSGWGILGPSGIQYNGHRVGSLCNDTLYIVDGVDDTIVAVSKASNLLTAGEIVVQPGGKKFTCKQKKFTCATLVYSGTPLNAPVALAILPNGNLVAANTQGGNKLVEISAAGKLLATKSVDKSSVAHIFGLIASGSSDSNTVLYYTDTKDNSVHELEP